jgi:hypothetical protein
LYRTRSLPRLGDLTLGDRAEIKWQPLTEMHIGIAGFTHATPYAFEAARPSLRRLLTQAAELEASAVMPPARVSTASTRVTRSGQTWTGVRWPASSWTDTRELIGSAHSTQP